MKDAVIFFNIKDKSLFSNNQCLAEAFLSFSDIPEYSQQEKVKQIHLTLTRLQNDGKKTEIIQFFLNLKHFILTDMESLKALALRSQSGDKAAKDFLAKIKSKTVNSTTKQTLPVIKL